MRGVNKVILVGRLGNDPITRQFQNGGSVTNISVATSEQWTDKQTGERREATEWHRVSFFGKLAEIAGSYLKKGSAVYIEGSLRTNKYTDQNGIERYSTDIRADNLQMLDSNPNNNNFNNSQNFGGYPNQNQGFNQPNFNNNNRYQNQNNFPNNYQNQGFNGNAYQNQDNFGNPATMQQGYQNNSFMQNNPSQPVAQSTKPTTDTPKDIANNIPKTEAPDDDIPF